LNSNLSIIHAIWPHENDTG